MGQAIKYILLAAVSLSAGYWAGITLRPATTHSKESLNVSENNEASSREDRRISSTEIDQAGDDCKLVLVVRTDLGMSSGKIAAQCSHATLACYKTLLSTNPLLLKRWEHTGQTKVALRCKDEDELLLLETQARSLNLCARSIQDAGRTQIAAGSRTVLGIAGPTKLINQITGKLRLL